VLLLFRSNIFPKNTETMEIVSKKSEIVSVETFICWQIVLNLAALFCVQPFICIILNKVYIRFSLLLHGLRRPSLASRLSTLSKSISFVLDYFCVDIRHNFVVWEIWTESNESEANLCRPVYRFCLLLALTFAWSWVTLMVTSGNVRIELGRTFRKIF